MNAKISMFKYSLQCIEDEIKNTEASLDDRKNTERGLQEKLERMEKEIEERVSRRGAVTVDALVARAGEGFSPSTFQWHYLQVSTFTLLARRWPSSLQ